MTRTAAAEALAVSIVIRTRNEATHLDQVLAALKMQSRQDFEVVVVDSGSTDGTLDIARNRGARILELLPQDFTFGRALNIGTNAAHAPVVAFLSGHSIPIDGSWLDALLRAIGVDGVAAVFGRQVPHADCNPFERRNVRRAYPAEGRTFTDDPPFSNANSAVHRTLALQVPWDEDAAYAEDRLWARRITADGWRVVYEPTAAVLHSHNEPCGAVLRRQRMDTREEVRLFGHCPAVRSPLMIPVAFVGGLLRDWARLAADGDGPAWWLRAPAYRYAKVVGAWLGCRDAARLAARGENAR